MRKALATIAFVAAMWAGQAQAAVKLSLLADLTTAFDDIDPAPPQIYEQFNVPITIIGDSWEATRFYLYGASLTCGSIQDSVGGCLKPTFSGNTLSFLAPEVGYFYGSLKISLVFDQDIESDPSVIRTASFVGGFYDEGYAHGGLSTSISGPITSLWVSVPEPATWATLVAGFGLVGAAMRRTKRRIYRGAAMGTKAPI